MKYEYVLSSSLLKDLKTWKILKEKRLACVCCLSPSAACGFRTVCYVSQFPSKGRAILICYSYLKSPSVLNLSPYSDFLFSLLVCQRIYVCLFFKVLFSRDNERSQAVSTNFKT